MQILETADDQEQGRVVIQKPILVQIEKMLTAAGLDESSMSKISHHALVGALAYLHSAPVSGMKLSEVKSVLRKNKSAFKMLARTITKTTEEPEEEGQ